MEMQTVGGLRYVLSVSVLTTMFLALLTPTRTFSYTNDSIIRASTCKYKSSETSGVARSELSYALYAVSYCESRHRQYNSSGEPIYSRLGSEDIGRWQINIPTWGEKAEELGYNLRTERGNYKMARWIYHNVGLDQWSPSSECLANNFDIFIN